MWLLYYRKSDHQFTRRIQVGLVVSVDDDDERVERECLVENAVNALADDRHVEMADVKGG